MFTHAYFLRFQTLTTPSTLADRTWRPRLIQETFTREVWCPESVDMHWPEVRFQTFTVLSPLADTSSLSTGENEQSQTPFLWPCNVCTSMRSAEFQILIVLSWLEEAINLSFGDTLTTLMYFWWPITVMLADFTSMGLPTSSRSLKGVRSHTFIVLSWLADTKKLLFFGAKHTLATFSLWPENTAKHFKSLFHRRMVLSFDPLKNRELSLFWSTHNMMSEWAS